GSFLLGGVGGVTFLPVKLKRTQEEFGAHLPANHVTPLVDKDGQVAITLDPLGVHSADDCLGGWAYNQWFFQKLSAAMRDDCEFGGKAFDMFLFFGHEGLRDQQRESGIDMTGCL